MFRKLRRLSQTVEAQPSPCELVGEAKDIVTGVCEDHVSAARRCITSPDLADALVKDIHAECEEIKEYIVATKRFHLEVNSRSKDRVVSFGEKLSGRFMTAILRDRVSHITIFSTNWTGDLSAPHNPVSAYNCLGS